MLLQLIVPHYKERPDEMTPLLDSVKIQQAIDFNEVGMLIVYDGDEATELPVEEWEATYPFRIQHLRKPHGGVSAARNYGMDHADAEYIMFCDADDMFCHACGFRVLFDQFVKGFDTMVTEFIEETRVPGTDKPLFVAHKTDSTFVHGKVHRLAYLREYNIRFCDRLTIHEDSYFNILAQSCVPDPERAKYCPEKMYLWKWRDNSVCRHDPDYLLRTYPNMLDSNDALVDELARRGLTDKANAHAAIMIFESYYTLNRKEWLDKMHKDYRDLTELRVAEYFKKHRDKFEAVPEEQKQGIRMAVINRQIKGGMPMETITFSQWLNRIIELGKGVNK